MQQVGLISVVREWGSSYFNKKNPDKEKSDQVNKSLKNLRDGVAANIFSCRTEINNFLMLNFNFPTLK